jgi:hypothetical protein
VQEYAILHSVPHDIVEKTLQYVDARWKMDHGMDHEAVLGFLPVYMRAEVLHALHRYVQKEGCVLAVTVPCSAPAVVVANALTLDTVRLAWVVPPMQTAHPQGEAVSQLLKGVYEADLVASATASLHGWRLHCAIWRRCQGYASGYVLRLCCCVCAWSESHSRTPPESGHSIVANMPLKTVYKGELRMEKRFEGTMGQDNVLSVQLTKGSFFGEEALLPDSKLNHNTEVLAESMCVLYTLSSTHFHSVLEHFPEHRHFLNVRGAAQRLGLGRRLRVYRVGVRIVTKASGESVCKSLHDSCCAAHDVAVVVTALSCLLCSRTKRKGSPSLMCEAES